MTRISTEQQKVDRDKFSDGYELAFCGWKPCGFETISEYVADGVETRKFNGEWYWRPKDSFDNSNKAGAIE